MDSAKLWKLEEPLGRTLEEFARGRGKHVQAVREEYQAMVRRGEGVGLPEVSRREEDEGTVKFCLPCGEREGKRLESESVIIPMTSYRATSWHTLCVSSQIGCRMGCTFCETGRMGLIRNLTAGEIVRQRVVARRIRGEMMRGEGPVEARSEGADAGKAGHVRRTQAARFTYHNDGIQNIVFMGMGEPLDNLEEVAQAIRVLNDPAGLDFPMSQITVSTVGRIDGLRKLGELKWPNLRIAISLNAANDKLRDELMPVNKGMPLADLQRALVEYPKAGRGRYLIEYVMIKGVNDSLADADAVAEWVKPLKCIVNLIPYNPQRYASYETPSEEVILAFMARLKSHYVFTKRRVTHGRDLMGACGQLGNPEVRRKAGARLTVLKG